MKNKNSICFAKNTEKRLFIKKLYLEYSGNRLSQSGFTPKEGVKRGLFIKLCQRGKGSANVPSFLK